MKKGYRTIVAVVSLFLLVLIDQVTKFAAVKCLKGKEAFSLFQGVFELRILKTEERLLEHCKIRDGSLY